MFVSLLAIISSGLRNGRQRNRVPENSPQTASCISTSCREEAHWRPSRMGSLISYVASMLGWGPQYDTTPDKGTGLSELDRYLIKESWALVADKKTRKANGVEFFVQLFRAYPYMLEYFPWFQDLTEDQLRKSPKMKAHALNVMYTIGNYVDCMDDAEALVGQVGKLAETHIPRNIKTQQFQDLGTMFIPFLGSLLGSLATKDVTDAWGKLLGALVMVVGQKEKELEQDD